MESNLISLVPESILETVKLIKKLEGVLMQKKKGHSECMTFREKHTLYRSGAVSSRVSRASKSQVFLPCTEKKELHPAGGGSSAAICHFKTSLLKITSNQRQDKDMHILHR